MISKLCAFSHRSEFILQVLENELKETKYGTMQVMILAHNKNLLTYLHDAIEHRKFATVGYYVGGMKEADLKKSETCQVIIATYAMASEALDIKTLTTLFLATPKTDVIQAVGRILRVKHERPLVVDFIDTHDVFSSQWQKRRKYYASNNYTIMHTRSNLYAANKWTILLPAGSGKNKDIKDKDKGKTALGGVSAAALFINTEYKCHNEDEYDDDDIGNSMDIKLQSGKCFLMNY